MMKTSDVQKSWGLRGQIQTWAGSFETLPQAWSGHFDLTWGQETFCHAADVRALLVEAFRVTRRGGAIAFTDIMLSGEATADQAEMFSEVNAIVRLATSMEYRSHLSDAGFSDIRFEDWTPHLGTNFRRMRDQIDHHEASLRDQGVSQEYLQQFAQSLEKRILWAEANVFQWGAFAARRPVAGVD